MPSGRVASCRRCDRLAAAQAEALLSSLQGVGHVIADAAYDAAPLRAFIVKDLGATAQIGASPSRAAMPSIDWRLYKERHQVECFFNKLKRFRRIALRCDGPTAFCPSPDWGEFYTKLEEDQGRMSADDIADDVRPILPPSIFALRNSVLIT